MVIACGNFSIPTGSSSRCIPDGDTFWGCSLGYKEFGIVDEEWFPYKTTFDPNYIPDNELIEIGKAARFFKSELMYSQTQTSPPEDGPMGFSDQQISSILGDLDNNIPVAVGFTGANNISMVDWGDLKGIWDDIPDWKLQKAAKQLWGHSVAIVGYCVEPVIPSGGYFIFRNSWGEGFGDKGYGHFTFNYVRKFVHDAVLFDRSPKFLHGVTMVKEPVRVKLPPPSPNVIDRLKKLKNLKS
jgi:hypothetical protein